MDKIVITLIIVAVIYILSSYIDRCKYRKIERYVHVLNEEGRYVLPPGEYKTYLKFYDVGNNNRYDQYIKLDDENMVTDYHCYNDKDCKYRSTIGKPYKYNTTLAGKMCKNGCIVTDIDGTTKKIKTEMKYNSPLPIDIPYHKCNKDRCYIVTSRGGYNKPYGASVNYIPIPGATPKKVIPTYVSGTLITPPVYDTTTTTPTTPTPTKKTVKVFPKVIPVTPTTVSGTLATAPVVSSSPL